MLDGFITCYKPTYNVWGPHIVGSDSQRDEEGAPRSPRPKAIAKLSADNVLKLLWWFHRAKETAD